MKDNETIKIFISGDFAPKMRVSEAIEEGNYQCLFNDVLPIIKESDIAITNLECPLVDKGIPIAKTGPNLKASTKSIEAVKYAGFDMVTLANNHALDYGAVGLKSTMDLCKGNGIEFIGAGNDLSEAKSIKYFDIKGKKIAFINCCENEWSTTHDNTPGCNPLDEISLFYQISEAKSNSDYTIIIIHGGHETYELPSPRMKKLYRWFIDLGVNAFIGHHTHCFSGYEIYKGKPIIYSLGNFIFDSNRRNTSWNIGAAIVLSIYNDDIAFNLHPYTQCDDSVGVHLFDYDKAKEWLSEQITKTLLIQDDYALEKEFDKFVSKQERLYRTYLEPKSFSWIQAAKNRGLLPRRIRGDKALLYKNIIRAEAHRDIIIKLLSK